MSKTNKGLVIGKFDMPHVGHLFMIMEAAKLCHELTVVVCIDHEHDPMIIPAEVRISAMEAEFAIFDNIKVTSLDCTGYPYSGTDDEEVSKYWANSLYEKFPDTTTLFGSEKYVEYMALHWPKCTGVRHLVIDLDRRAFPVSATMIRNDVYTHFNLIAPTIRPYFTKNVLVIGPESCVPGTTEFFNGKEWKPISEYADSDQVLQYNEDGTASLVNPERYIAAKADNFFQFKNSYGNWTQTFCPDHDLVLLTSKGNLIKKKCTDVVSMHFQNKTGISHKLLTSFKIDGTQERSHSVPQMRLAVAISADGTLVKRQWRVRLIKDRKISRMRSLIESAGYEVDERVYEDGSHNFYLPDTAGSRLFDMNLVFTSLYYKAAFLNELQYWDSHVGKSSTEYSTTLRHNADVVMTVAASIGVKVNFYIDSREDRTDCYKLNLVSSTKYRTLEINQHNAAHRDEMVKEIPSEDGMKYCFTVPSGMLVLREANHIFITGNCGKSTLVNILGKLLSAPTIPEMYRSMFPDKGMDFTPEDLVEVAKCQNRAALSQRNSPLNKGLVIHDTCNSVTLAYAVEYYPDRKDIHELIEQERKEHEHPYDLILFCEPTNIDWVNDGTRTLGDEKDRLRMRNIFYSLAIAKGKQYGCSVISLPADHVRLSDAYAAIEGILNGDKTLNP